MILRPMNIVKTVFQMKLKTICERCGFKEIFSSKGLEIRQGKSTLAGFVKYLPSVRMDCTIPRFTVQHRRCAASRDLLRFGLL